MPGFLDQKEPGKKQEIPPDQLTSFSYWRDNFCYTTPIHGYSFLPRSLHWYERSMWMALIIICSCVCLRDVVNLVILFKSEPTGSIVSIQTNKTLNFPTSAVCFEIATSSISLPGITDALALLNNFAPKLPDFLDYNRTLEIQIDRRVLYLTYKMLVQMVICEQKSCVNRSSDKFNIVDYHLSNDSSDYQYWLMTFTYEFYAKRKVAFDRLLQVTGGQICHLMNGRISHFKFDEDGNDLHTETSFCRPENVVYMGVVSGQKDTLCIRLSKSEVTFNSTTETMKLELSTANFYELTTKNQMDLLRTSIFFDLSGGVEVLDFTKGDSYITVPFETYVSASVEIAAYYSSFSMKRKRCTATENKFICESSCKSKFVQENWGCRILSYSNLIPEGQNEKLQICSPFNASMKILLQREPGEQRPELSKCRDSCLSECNNIDYLFLQHGFNSPAYSTSDGVTTLVIYARKFRYPVVTEYPTLGWAEFLASFGGSIGFYIGGSILAFIHVPLYLLHMGVFYFRKWAGLCRNSAQPSQPIQVPPGRVTYSSTSNPTGISVY